VLSGRWHVDLVLIGVAAGLVGGGVVLARPRLLAAATAGSVLVALIAGGVQVSVGAAAGASVLLAATTGLSGLGALGSLGALLVATRDLDADVVLAAGLAAALLLVVQRASPLAPIGPEATPFVALAALAVWVSVPDTEAVAAAAPAAVMALAAGWWRTGRDPVAASPAARTGALATASVALVWAGATGFRGRPASAAALTGIAAVCVLGGVVARVAGRRSRIVGCVTWVVTGLGTLALARTAGLQATPGAWAPVVAVLVVAALGASFGPWTRAARPGRRPPSSGPSVPHRSPAPPPG